LPSTFETLFLDLADGKVECVKRLPAPCRQQPTTPHIDA
jgi:hypothetical protein